jgi:hypothetical protein
VIKVIAQDAGDVDDVRSVQEAHVGGGVGSTLKLSQVGQRQLGQLATAECGASQAHRLETRAEVAPVHLVQIPDAEQRLAEPIAGRPVKARERCDLADA